MSWANRRQSLQRRRLNRQYTRDRRMIPFWLNIFLYQNHKISCAIKHAEWCFNRRDFSHRNARRRRETRLESAFSFDNMLTRARHSSPFLEAPDRSTEEDEVDWLQDGEANECEPIFVQTKDTWIDSDAAQDVNVCDPFHFPPLTVYRSTGAKNVLDTHTKRSRAFRWRSFSKDLCSRQRTKL